MRFRRSLKSHKFGKVIVILVLLVIFLQIIHMIMIARFEAKELQGKKTVPYRHDQSQSVNGLIRQMERRIENSYRLDNSGTYHMIENIVKPTQDWSSEDNKLSIITQCSSNHLHYLVPLTKRWDGPVSVSVFTFDKDISNALNSIAYYHLCFKQIQQTTYFHLVYPINRTPVITTDNKSFEQNCEKMLNLKETFLINYDNEGILYPHNLLRNLAIRHSVTRYVLMTDIDMLPSVNLKNNFHSLVNLLETSGIQTMKTAFVLPAFEAKYDIDIPSDKKELIAQWDRGTLRPFYKMACWKCQKYTKYDKWKMLESKANLEVAYSLTWKDPWEPFFIGDRSFPLYDERFKQYGFNRISQVCEMHIAGINFAVLNNAFLVHHGFKEPNKFHKTKEDELNRNRLLFRQFKEELKVKYPDSSRRCY